MSSAIFMWFACLTFWSLSRLSQIHLSPQLCCFFSVISEHMSSLPSAVSDGSFPSPSMGLPSAAPSASLGLPSAAAPPSSIPTTTSRVENSSSRSLPPHLGFSQNKDVPSASSAPLMVRINTLVLCICLIRL